MRLQRLNLGLSLKSSILDVGCGSGQLLQEFAALGFRNLTGVDPFIEKDIFYDNGPKILKRELDELDQQFDFIMLHHSFEHMAEPLSTLKKVKALLKAKRYILIRIPVADSYAWKEYGADWYALDAPRHFYLHTRNSMKILADQANLEIADVVFDADGLSHWASRQYIQDIPFMDKRSRFIDPTQSIFAKEEMDAFAALDADLNKRGDADLAGFYFYKR